jgi:hypothetical protein
VDGPGDEVTEPQLGDYFCVRTDGWEAKVIRFVTWSPVNHSGVCVGFTADGGVLVVEAEPHGAAPPHLLPYATVFWSHMALTPEERTAIADAATAKVGTPYSWLDDAAIGLAKLVGKRASKSWLFTSLRKRLSRPDRLMCSQLVDLCYHEAGVELFPDHRAPGDVSPGDLYTLIPQETVHVLP